LHVSYSLEQVINRAQPSGPGQRNRCLFELARSLKAVAGLDTSLGSLHAIVAEWHQRALPHIRTKDFRVSWGDFRVAWDKVKYPAGASFEVAVTRAKTIAVPVSGLIDEDAEYHFVVALFADLQRQWGDKPVPFSCRKLAETLGCGKDKACRILQTLKKDGIVVEVSKGSQYTGKASEWKYVGDHR
jgi:hypothetical protein